MIGSIRRAIETFIYWISRPLSNRLVRIMLQQGEASHIESFRIVLLDIQDRKAATEKLKRALCLIRDHDPRRYGWLETNIDVIAIVGFNTKSQYAPAFSAVLLRQSFFDQLEADSIASVLVHEASHARLERLGVRYSPWAKQRIERLCLRNQMWFTEKLPQSSSLARVTREDYQAVAAASSKHG